MAEFEKIAQQEKSTFTTQGSALYPQYADFISKIFVYGNGGRDDRIDTGLTDEDFNAMLAKMSETVSRQTGDELTITFNTLCEMLIYLENGGKKLNRKLVSEIIDLQSSVRRLLASRID